MIKRLLCKLLGHKPILDTCNYRDGQLIAKYYRCSRCGASSVKVPK